MSDDRIDLKYSTKQEEKKNHFLFRRKKTRFYTRFHLKGKKTHTHESRLKMELFQQLKQKKEKVY
jgi:hypothetical protein